MKKPTEDMDFSPSPGKITCMRSKGDEKIVIHSIGSISLRNRLKEVKVAGVTDAQIDELFQQYQ